MYMERDEGGKRKKMYLLLCQPCASRHLSAVKANSSHQDTSGIADVQIHKIPEDKTAFIFPKILHNGLTTHKTFIISSFIIVKSPTWYIQK